MITVFDQQVPKTMIIIGTSVIGVSHLKSGLPCQDACNYKVTNKGTAIVAVADGVGSVPKSDIGAKFVVSEAISQLEQIEQTKDKIDTEDIRNVVALTREKLKEMANQMNEDFENLATTLILLVAYITQDNQKEVLIAHVGDGAVVAKSDKLEILSLPEESEYINEVTPITSESWEKYMRLYKFTKDFECIAVMTDGCQPAAFKKQDGVSVPFEGFFEPIFQYSKSITNPEEGTEEIRKLLSSQKINQYIYDDKTLVVLVFENIQEPIKSD